MTEIMNQGDKSRINDLVKTGLFDRFFAEVLQQQTQIILNTKPDENKLREEAYYVTQGIEALKGMLQQCVNDTDGEY